MSLTLSPGTKTKVGRPSVIEAHPEVVEIKKAVKERQKAVTSICDGVPDWTPKSTPNLIYFGRSRRDLNLDIFILTSYAQGHTRHNPIECSWAPLSKWLTSVTHAIALEEKTSPWVDFAGLNENKICNWKAEVVHEECCKCRYWDGKKIDCSPVRVTCFASQSQGEQISDRELLKALAISIEKKTKSNPNLAILASCRSKYRFLMDIWQRKCIKLNLSSALVHSVMTDNNLSSKFF